MLITCWSCNVVITEEARSEADGFCPNCDAEIEMEDEDREVSE